MTKDTHIRPPKINLPPGEEDRLTIRPPKLGSKRYPWEDTEISAADILLIAPDVDAVEEWPAVQKPKLKGRAVPVKPRKRSQGGAQTSAGPKAAAGSARKSRISTKPAKSGPPQGTRRVTKAAPPKTRAQGAAKKKRSRSLKIHPPHLK